MVATGIPVLVGALLFEWTWSLIVMAALIWGNIAVYIVSYYRNEGSSVSLSSTAIMLPLCILLTGPFKYLGSQLSMKIGAKR